MLGRLLGGLRPLDHHGVEGRGEELVVAHVRSGNYHRKRASIGLYQKGTFYPVLASVSRVGACEISPQRALPIAPSAACHSQSTPRTPLPAPPRSGRAPPAGSTAGKPDAPSRRRGTPPWASGFTGSLSSAGR